MCKWFSSFYYAIYFHIGIIDQLMPGLYEITVKTRGMLLKMVTSKAFIEISKTTSMVFEMEIYTKWSV